MFDGISDSIRTLRWFALFLLLPLGLLLWADATGTRLLGGDNESTETLNAPGTGGRGHGGRGLYFHK